MTLKKINSGSALYQKEINLAGTFHQGGGTASRQSFLGTKYFIIMKENQSIVSLCALWMWKLFTQKPGSTLPVIFFSHHCIFYYFLMESSQTLAVSRSFMKHKYILSVWEMSGNTKDSLICFSAFFFINFPKTA